MGFRDGDFVVFSCVMLFVEVRKAVRAKRTACSAYTR